jgi:hypothetical protein
LIFVSFNYTITASYTKEDAMAPKLVTMLTNNDETVKDAKEIFLECADLDCEYWGFKDIGLEQQAMKDLVQEMKKKKKITCLEVVTLTEPECLAAAKLALECEFDYLMGTVYYPSVGALMKGKKTKYSPFCGRVHGHPSILEGSPEEIAADGKRLESLGVNALDLLAYRNKDRAEEGIKKLIQAVKIPVVVAGSIDSYERLDKMKELDPFGFTIGSAFFSKKFVSGGSFRQQMEAVIAYLKK